MPIVGESWAVIFFSFLLLLFGIFGELLAEACKEMIWLQRIMGELGKEHDMGTLYSDSQSAIHLSKNTTFHSRTKHIQLKYQFI